MRNLTKEQKEVLDNISIQLAEVGLNLRDVEQYRQNLESSAFVFDIEKLVAARFVNPKPEAQICIIGTTSEEERKPLYPDNVSHKNIPYSIIGTGVMWLEKGKVHKRYFNHD